MTSDSPAPAPPARVRVAHEIPIFDSAQFEHMLRIANVLARSSLMPDHLRGVKEGTGAAAVFVPYEFETVAANALIVVNLAMKWRADPLAIAQAISIVHGKIVFEGKLIAAIIEDAIGSYIDYEWYGPENSTGRGIIVRATRPGSEKAVEIKGTVADWQTFDRNNKPNAIWVGQKQDKQLAYRGAREWCRLYMPGLILGLYGADEFDATSSTISDEAPVIHAGFAKPAQPAIEHKPGVDVAAELARTAPDREAVLARAQTQVDKAEARAAGGGLVSEASRELVHSDPATPENKGSEAAAGVDENQDQEDSIPTDEELEAKRRREVDKVFGKGGWKALHNAIDEAHALEKEAVELGLAIDPPGLSRLEGLWPSETEWTAAECQERLGILNKGRDALAKAIAIENERREVHTGAADAPGAPTPRQATFEECFGSLDVVMRTAKDWEILRTTLANFIRTPEWKRASEDQRSQVYATCWKYANLLNVAELSKGDAGQGILVHPNSDLVAFRCALEAADEKDLVLGMWEDLTASDGWDKQPEGNRAKISNAVHDRLKKIETVKK